MAVAAIAPTVLTGGDDGSCYLADSGADADVDVDADSDADSDADADADSDTDTDTDTDIPVTTGFFRIVHLLVDVPAVNVHLNGDPSPINADPLLRGQNTDPNGLDYVPAPQATYQLDARDPYTGASELLFDFDLILGEYTTLAMIGPAGAHEDLQIVDDLSPVGAGQHRLTIVHVAPGLPPVDVMCCGVGVQWASLAYTDVSTATVNSGLQTLSFDEDGDGLSDRSFDLDLLDGGWSYFYVFPDGLGSYEGIWHERGTDTLPVLPN